MGMRNKPPTLVKFHPLFSGRCRQYFIIIFFEMQGSTAPFKLKKIKKEKVMHTDKYCCIVPHNCSAES